MKKSLQIALYFSGAIIVSLILLNRLTSAYPWSLYPIFGVLWWPLSVYSAGRHEPLHYAVYGTALIFAMLLLTYLFSSPGAHPWFIYPVFGVIWWPVSVYFKGKQQPLVYAVFGFVLLTGLFLALYLAATPGAHPWVLYPVLGIVWWPLSVWGKQKGARAYSVAGALCLIVSLLMINLVTSPGFWWWVYPAFFVLWWPMPVLLGKRANTLTFALGSATAASLFLFIMHSVQTPEIEPWYLYAILPFFWWPVSMLLSKRVNALQNALIGVLVFALYYTGILSLLHGVNSLLSPFLLFAGVWLVYAMSLSKHRTSVGFSAVNAALLAVYFVLVHRFITPDIQPWYWYTFFPLLWWPVAAALKAKAVHPLPVAACAALGLASYGVLNWLITPAVPWVLFLSLPAVSAIIFSLCYQRRAWITLSIGIAAAGIAWFAAINLVYTPYTVWAVYPAFGLLWWPLSMLLFGRKPKSGETETQ